MTNTRINNFTKSFRYITNNYVALSFFVISTLLLFFAYFRFAIYDEKLYLRETVLMSELLKQNVWFGNYGVGVHGFFFKLPVAIVFMFTGPSIWLATCFHLLLALASAILFYKITKLVLVKNSQLFSLSLFITNFSFLSWSITYQRETPVLFALLVFIYALLSKRNSIILGLSLLLILDAKEHVFFTLIPAYLLWILLSTYLDKRNFKDYFKQIFIETFFSLIPSLIYLYLMFYTPLIPVNMFIASILGQTEYKFNYEINHTRMNNTLSDLSTYKNTNIIYNYILLHSKTNIFIKLLEPLLIIFAYLEKLFYLSNFSFLCIPLIIFTTSFIYSFQYFKTQLKKRNLPCLFLPLFFWVYIFIYLIRTSQERYLYSLLPVAIIFFTMYIVDKKIKINMRIISLVTGLLFLIISIFYPSSDFKRYIFNIVGQGLILLLLMINAQNPSFQKQRLIVFLLCVFSLFLFIFASLTKNQFYQSTIWGINGETKQINSYFKKEDKLLVIYEKVPELEWVYLLTFYRKDLFLIPEWEWNLGNWVPKRKMLKAKSENTFLYYSDELPDIKQTLKKEKINKILLLEISGHTKPKAIADYFNKMVIEKKLILNQKINLKNKIVNIYTRK